jgi:hypothetical protein
MRYNPARKENRMEWQPIETAPHDGREVLVYVNVADTPIIRNAAWCDGVLWQEQGSSSQEEAQGWWYYVNSVSQDKMDGVLEPTNWMPRPKLPSG